MNRKGALEMLWNATVDRFKCYKNEEADRTLHAINVFAGSPGTGKSSNALHLHFVYLHRNVTRFYTCLDNIW
jgi:predicted ATPase